MDSLTREQFRTLAPTGRLVPVYRELAADLETPVSVYLRLRGQGPSFLLESVERAEQVGRYSILGTNPRRQIVGRGRMVEIIDDGHTETREPAPGQDPLHVIAAEMAGYLPLATPAGSGTAVRELPRFFGGAVGYFGYDLGRWLEPRAAGSVDSNGSHAADLLLMITDTLLIFDHVQSRLLLIANAKVAADAGVDAVYDNATARLDALEARLAQPLPPHLLRVARLEGADPESLHASLDHEEFDANARQAKEAIACGEVLSVALSQRVSRLTAADPFTMYRALRRLNPSPNMFILEMGGSPPVTLIGSSPETLVRLEGREAELRPLSGMRPRGKTPAEDRALEADLLADADARAEHVLLVDVTRNDLGRVAEFGSLRVPDLMFIEPHTHAMHLVSRVRGRLRDGVGSFDLLRATFPPARVTGAHKERAMRLVQELEGRRGPFGGAVGYIGFNGNLDVAIAQHVILIEGQTAHLQAGVAVTAGSDPTGAWDTIVTKLHSLSTAIDVAEQGL